MVKERFTLANIFWRILLIIWALIILVPLLFIVMQALKTNREFFAGVWNLPKKLQFINFINAWNRIGMAKSFLNTIYFVGVSLFLGLFLTALAAFSFTRLKWKGRKFFYGVVMLSLFLPGINALVPEYLLMQSMGLTNSIEGLILISSIGMNAFNLMLLGSFMSSIPKELEESADMDGASIFKIFRSIIMPLSIPGLVTVGIFRFLGLYNNFTGPYIYLEPSKYPIGVTLYNANSLMMYKNDYVTMFAGVLISMIPVIAVYILFQDRIVEGATIGSMKG